jgi:hypothetical protein
MDAISINESSATFKECLKVVLTRSDYFLLQMRAGKLILCLSLSGGSRILTFMFPAESKKDFGPFYVAAETLLAFVKCLPIEATTKVAIFAHEVGGIYDQICLEYKGRTRVFQFNTFTLEVTNPFVLPPRWVYGTKGRDVMTCWKVYPKDLEGIFDTEQCKEDEPVHVHFEPSTSGDPKKVDITYVGGPSIIKLRDRDGSYSKCVTHWFRTMASLRNLLQPFRPNHVVAVYVKMRFDPGPDDDPDDETRLPTGKGFQLYVLAVDGILSVLSSDVAQLDEVPDPPKQELPNPKKRTVPDAPQKGPPQSKKRKVS